MTNNHDTTKILIDQAIDLLDAIKTSHAGRASMLLNSDAVPKPVIDPPSRDVITVY